MRKFLCFFLIIISLISKGQGYNHQWLLGYYDFFQDPKGRILFNNSSYQLINENRKMPFYGTEANISDNNGNLLMSSNGIWIANALGDTLKKGNGLNPGSYASTWQFGMPTIYNNIFLPNPTDTNLFTLFHQTQSNPNFPSGELFKTTIDINLDGGLGEVISKNDTVYTDSLSWGIGACRHANGRDWWVVTMRDSSDIAVISLFSDTGISTHTQSLGFNPWPGGSVSQLTFSPDGNKFILMTYDNPINQNGYVVVSDFDRCNGQFNNTQVIPVVSNDYIWGMAFSSSGRYVYSCSSNFIFQVDVNTYSVDTVATYDGFISPPSLTCCPTTFWNMYLAANGKIYVTSGSGVQHLHVINYPDSAGFACDVQQHSISLGYGQLRAVPNHPNYYLGCDTTSGCPCLLTGLNEMQQHDFKFSVSPNPLSNGQLKIAYLLPQNKKGVFEIFDVNGRKVFSMPLPQWSTLQNVLLPELSSGIYSCSITSGNKRVSKKLVMMKQ